MLEFFFFLKRYLSYRIIIMAIQWWRKTRHRLSAVLLFFSSSSSSSSSEKRKIKTNSNVIYPRSHSWMLSPERGLHYSSLSLLLTLVWLRSVNIGSSVPISTWLPVNRCEKDLGQWTRFIRVTRKWSLSFSPTPCAYLYVSLILRFFLSHFESGQGWSWWQKTRLTKPLDSPRPVSIHSPPGQYEKRSIEIWVSLRGRPFRVLRFINPKLLLLFFFFY